MNNLLNKLGSKVVVCFILINAVATSCNQSSAIDLITIAAKGDIETQSFMGDTFGSQKLPADKSVHDPGKIFEKPAVQDPGQVDPGEALESRGLKAKPKCTSEEMLLYPEKCKPNYERGGNN